MRRLVVFILLLVMLLNTVHANGEEQINWLKNQQNAATWLVDSYEGDAQNYAYTYDQALAVISFIDAGEIDRAKNILNRFKLLQNADGSWYYCHFANNGNICGYNKRAGDIAWMIMAINYYEVYTSEDSYANMARKALNFLDTLRDANPAHETYGAVKMEPGLNKYSTENNYDVYSAYSYRGVLENNYSFIKKADLIKDYLIKEMWSNSSESDGPYHNVGVFWVGYQDFGWYTDPQSWGVLALGGYGPNNENFTRALDWLYTYGYGYGSTRHTQTYNPEIDGFDFWTKPIKNSTWLEGTEGVAAAYYSTGEYKKGDYFHNQTKKLVSPNGGIIYSFSETNPPNMYFPDNFRYNSIASTTWYYFNEKSINPFKLGISWYDYFVKVNGTNFYLNGKPFYFAGANNYYLFYKPLSTTQEVLNDAANLNLTVIRTWGFNDGSGYMPFQSSPRKYDEATFKFFDRIIKEASDRNIKLIVPLVNNWDDFGGMCQYVRWCNLTDANQCNADEPYPFGRPTEVHDLFYTNECTKQLYKDYASYFLNRVNTITGIKYKDTPAIFAWELANEPRCRSDTSTVTLNNWIGEMSDYVKSIDSNHMVTPGGDGGYKDKPSNPSWSWWYHGNEGQAFIENHQWPNVDFATFRYYPELGKFDNVNVSLWFQQHADDAHNIIGKPVIAEEFGSVNNKLTDFANFYSLIETNNINGDIFWLLSDSSKPGNDGYFISCPEDNDICNLIKNHALYVYNKSRLFVDFSINLKNGWNLISIPLALDNNSVANVFSGITYSGLFYYNKGWKVPTKIESNKGYWVKVNGNHVMGIRGNPIENPKFNASISWDLLGYPYLEEKDISGLSYNVTAYRYNNSRWYSYVSGRGSNGFNKFVPGYGYWIKKI